MSCSFACGPYDWTARIWWSGFHFVLSIITLNLAGDLRPCERNRDKNGDGEPDWPLGKVGQIKQTPVPSRRSARRSWRRSEATFRDEHRRELQQLRTVSGTNSRVIQLNISLIAPIAVCCRGCNWNRFFARSVTKTLISPIDALLPAPACPSTQRVWPIAMPSGESDIHSISRSTASTMFRQPLHRMVIDPLVDQNQTSRSTAHVAKRCFRQHLVDIGLRDILSFRLNAADAGHINSLAEERSLCRRFWGQTNNSCCEMVTFTNKIFMGA
jgi:hypothetical protein